MNTLERNPSYKCSSLSNAEEATRWLCLLLEFTAQEDLDLTGLNRIIRLHKDPHKQRHTAGLDGDVPVLPLTVLTILNLSTFLNLFDLLECLVM